jgi:hypothetical protein
MRVLRGEATASISTLARLRACGAPFPRSIRHTGLKMGGDGKHKHTRAAPRLRRSVPALDSSKKQKNTNSKKSHDTTTRPPRLKVSSSSSSFPRSKKKIVRHTRQSSRSSLRHTRQSSCSSLISTNRRKKQERTHTKPRVSRWRGSFFLHGWLDVCLRQHLGLRRRLARQEPAWFPSSTLLGGGDREWK